MGLLLDSPTVLLHKVVCVCVCVYWPKQNSSDDEKLAIVSCGLLVPIIHSR